MISRYPLKVLYIGPLAYGGTCLHRQWALEELGFDVVGIDTGIPSGSPLMLRFLLRLWRRIEAGSWVFYINRKIINALEITSPDVVWIDKGLSVKPETLKKLKSSCPDAITVSYSPDDMMNPNNQTRNYLECIPIYDYHVTTKSYNVEELKQLGAREVVMVDNAYCSRSHKPVALTQTERQRLGGPVGFIGGWEKEREQYMMFLSENNVPIRIWGAWNRNGNYHPNMHIEGRVAWGDDYARTASAFDINLCFLRKENRDLQTTRSIEIPACGGFMLAERTDEHLSLFEEGKEAEFFDNEEELLSKVRYYLRHEEARRKVALAGFQRCVKGGYSNMERLDKVMKFIFKKQ